ncbi:MAG TPA: hypothetical protein VMU55_04145, partial [Solirubrobacteraceae bacterium]|nr:hypothetical protein [Solirubrobacteraceae bacterium]
TTITEEDIEQFEACAAYLKITPQVVIVRPEGSPAMPAYVDPRTGTQYPARAAQPPRPYVVVKVVENGTDNAMRAAESTAEGQGRAVIARARRNARQGARQLAATVKQQATVGDFNSSVIIELCETVELIAAEEPQ